MPGAGDTGCWLTARSAGLPPYRTILWRNVQPCRPSGAVTKYHVFLPSLAVTINCVPNLTWKISDESPLGALRMLASATRTSARTCGTLGTAVGPGVAVGPTAVGEVVDGLTTDGTEPETVVQ